MKILFKFTAVLFLTIMIKSCNSESQKEITLLIFDGVNQEVDGNFYMSYVDSIGNIKHPKFKPNYEIKLDEKEISELENILKINYPYHEFVDSTMCIPNYRDVILINDKATKKKLELLICFDCGQLDSYPKIKGLGNLAVTSRFDSLKSFFKRIDSKMNHTRDWDKSIPNQ